VIYRYTQQVLISSDDQTVAGNNFQKTQIVASAVLAVLLIASILFIYPELFPRGPSSDDYPTYTANAVWILNVGWVTMNQNVLQNSIDSVLENLNNSRINFAFVFVGYWNSTSNDIDYSMSDELITATIDGLHSINITVLAWAENADSKLDVTPPNRDNLYASITKCVNKGFDGYNDDVEAYSGTLQDYIDYLNNATTVLHHLGKMMTADVGYDWQQNTNPYLHMDYIVTMFYGSKSLLEDQRVVAYWEKNFGQYFWNDNPPGSPVILGIMNYYGNEHPLSWQLEKVDELLSNYGHAHPKLEGFSLWTYEYMGTNPDDWQQWNNWITNLQTQNSPK
jgi:hypothetical protein